MGLLNISLQYVVQRSKKVVKLQNCRTTVYRKCWGRDSLKRPAWTGGRSTPVLGRCVVSRIDGYEGHFLLSDVIECLTPFNHAHKATAFNLLVVDTGAETLAAHAVF